MKRSHARILPPVPVRRLAGRIALLFVTLGSLVGAPRGQAASTPPDRLPYQGHLVDGNGDPLGNSAPANHQVNFRIWSEATAGELKWSEQQTVTVDKGLFSVTLGEGTTPGGEPGPALSSIFAGDTVDKRFLELTVNIGGTPLTLLPRLRLLPAPYAFLATQANQIVAANGTPLINSTGGALTVPGAASFGGRLSLGSSLGNTKLAVWDGDGGLNAYGLGVSGGDFRFHVNGSGSLFSFRPGRDADPVMTLSGAGVLSLRNNLADTKLALWGDGLGAYGVGVQSGDMRFHLGNAGNNRFSFLGAPNASTPLMSIHSSGKVAVWGANHVEFGAGVAGKDGAAGFIGYQTFTGGALDIVGAGTSGSNRRIKLWTEGGATFTGPIDTAGDLNLRNTLYVWNDKSTLVLGHGVAGKEASSGTISYRKWSAGLDVVGVSDDLGQNRRIKFWAEGNASFTGKVGIGTDNPRAGLEVNLNGPATDLGSFAYYSKDGALNPWTGRASGGTFMAILANGRITGHEFNAFSDARIKDVVGASDTRKDLDLVRQLRVTDYRMVDKAVEGTEVRKGFLAQEVEQVIPEAVSRTTKVIPDIYSLATKTGFDATRREWFIAVARDLEIRKGDRVQVLADTNLVLKTVVAVPSAREFVLGDCDGQPERIFVYGREVSDFRSLNYDRIFTTGIGAIQELNRQVSRQAAEIEELKKQVAGYRAVQAGWEARFRAIEAALAATGSGEAASARQVAVVNPSR